MLFKIIILSLTFSYLVIAFDKTEPLSIRDKIQRLYDGDLQNFDNVLSFVTDDVDNPADKIVGFQAVVDVMKENNHLYTKEMLKLTFKVKELMKETTLGNYAALFQNGQDLKSTLPTHVQNLTCSKVKFYQTFLKGYLYADFKIMWDKDRRYTFADGKFNDLSTTWTMSPQEEYVFIINEFFQECLYPVDVDSKRFALTYVPGTCGLQQKWAIEFVYGSRNIRLRNIRFHQYLYVSDEYLNKKRILATADNPRKNSYWEIHCAD